MLRCRTGDDTDPHKTQTKITSGIASDKNAAYHNKIIIIIIIR